MGRHEGFKRIEEAYKKSVALKKIGLEKGWTHVPPYPEETDEEREERFAKREFNYAVDLLNLDLNEFREIMKDQKQYYYEGGTMCGTGIYDVNITPMDEFEENGICTEKEGWLRVKI